MDKHRPYRNKGKVAPVDIKKEEQEGLCLLYILLTVHLVTNSC